MLEMYDRTNTSIFCFYNPVQGEEDQKNGGIYSGKVIIEWYFCPIHRLGQLTRPVLISINSE